jgi:fibronectin type 3 domain-containing protein
VYRATTAGGENFAVPLNTAAISTLWFYDTTVAIGTTYFYKVVAVGTGGVLSLPTPEVSSPIPVPPNSPTTPAAAID